MMKEMCLMAINIMKGIHWTEFDFRQRLWIFNLHLCPRTPRVNQLLCPSLDIETICFVTHSTMFDRQVWVKDIILLRCLCYQQRNRCLWQETVISLPKFIENRQLPSLDIWDLHKHAFALQTFLDVGLSSVTARKRCSRNNACDEPVFRLLGATVL